VTVMIVPYDKLFKKNTYRENSDIGNRPPKNKKRSGNPS
jgi:hypothetical protein